MQIPNAIHETGPWRIREIASDFTLEDAWDLPVFGSAPDFGALLEMMVSFDPANGDSLPARALWQLRDRLGSLLNMGSISSAAAEPTLAIPGCRETSLASRLPEELRGSASDIHFRSLPFTPLYRTDREFAAEISNATVHGLMQLAWVAQSDGRFRGRMGVYVRPRGAFGRAYMALISPFRHTIVYPALMAQVGRAWAARRPISPSAPG